MIPLLGWEESLIYREPSLGKNPNANSMFGRCADSEKYAN